nr:MAG TPA: hypothetical protein [Caudoviricetes sp.]
MSICDFPPAFLACFSASAVVVSLIIYPLSIFTL